MERVFDVLAMEEDKPDAPDARDAPSVVEEIRFADVSFEYREGRPVVRDFNVVVPGGSVIALVGRSGAGKTTVTDLVARFHDPTRGRILLNGEDIREFLPDLLAREPGALGGHGCCLVPRIRPRIVDLHRIVEIHLSIVTEDVDQVVAQHVSTELGEAPR
jgi:ABC-type bacteriocin/lantibiotic exporter with double-glycine peptidase domain